MDDRFRTTRWSVVLDAGADDADRARTALGALCEAYWVPLYAYARRRGAAPEQAEDFVQGFFARLLEKDALAAADPDRGRFRGFLATAFARHMSKEHAKATAQKRGGRVRTLSLDREHAESQYRLEPADDGRSPEQVFERRWAMTVLSDVMARLRDEWTRLGRSRDFDALSVFLGGHSPIPTHSEIADELGMTTGAVKVAVHRMRKRYRELLRDAVAETLGDERDVDEELRHLAAALR